MEIGNSKAKESFESLSDNNLFIHLRQDGASVLYTEELNRGLLGIYSKSWLATDKYDVVIDNLRSFLRDQDLASQDASSVTFFLSAPKFTLIPDILYEQDSGFEILNNTCRLESTDLIFSDFITHRDAVLIYALNKDYYNQLKGFNSNTHVVHNGYALNSLALKMSVSEPHFFLVSVSDSFAELFIIKENKLVFYNQFPHDVPEDLLYYVLSVFEQHRILAPEVKLQFMNYASKDPSAMKQLLRTYIGGVEDISYKPLARDAHRFSQAELRKVAHMHSAI